MGSLGILLFLISIVKALALVAFIGFVSGFFPVIGDLVRISIGSIFDAGENLAIRIKKSFKKGKKSEK